MKQEKGLVLKSTGSWYQVLAQNGELVELRLKGKIRLKGLKSTNPIAVGDYVLYDPETFTIADIEPRKNYLIRRSNNLSKYSHIIAANLDLAIVVASFKEPRTSQGFIDRFLLTCDAYDVPAIVLLNKIDLLEEEELLDAADFLGMYEEAGYPVHNISAKTYDEWEWFEELLKDKTVLISGHSGVGKSTIINKLIPEVEIKTGDISEVNYKGKHTTTFAEMHVYAPNSYIIDTPGIKDFGLVNMEKQEISHYFREMAPLIADCKFSNCLHVEEPGCAVREAAEQGGIDPNRYFSYLNIIEGDEELNTPDYVWRKTVPGG
ncbi:MAG: ribosome small subunit-dependent GTPase A [Bacteroidetes bacterium]|nr:ribosome small subunit-dependent GTPase A [Bacteroidota bacterium]